MKIKCIDGIVREFETSKLYMSIYSEAYCKHCKKSFGIHDTKVLIPEFKNHICKPNEK